MSNELTEVFDFLKKNKPTFTCNLLSNSKQSVTFTPTDGRVLKKLLIEKEDDTLRGKFQSLYNVAEQCLVGTKPNTLYLGDFFWVLANIRAKSNGETVTTWVECEHCNEENKEVKVKILEDFTITKLEQIVDKVIKISDNLEVELKFLTVGEYMDILKLSQDEQAIYTLAQYIDYIRFNDSVKEMSIEDKIEFLDNLTKEQINKITKFVNKNKFGIELIYKMQCQKCKEPITVDFTNLVLDFF